MTRPAVPLSEEAGENPHIREITRQAIRRETVAALRRGERLFEGRWLEPQEYETALRRRRGARFGKTIEALLFWMLVLIVSLGLLGLTTVIL
ncbi:hypothetical protein [Paracoccus ravus]|uniref:hypothetical protein n=1 Tax=Paracoccus ravus TaxID=2447760 RepID=UPI00106E1273|nr:hypothetical protein [Paracoccus ravus]